MNGWVGSGSRSGLAARQLKTGVGATLALFILASATSCSDRPRSFQTACDHLAAAIRADADGDATTAKDELTDAHSWGEPVFEDVAGSDQQEPAEAFFTAVSIALSKFGTDEGRDGLAEAKRACS